MHEFAVGGQRGPSVVTRPGPLGLVVCLRYAVDALAPARTTVARAGRCDAFTPSLRAHTTRSTPDAPTPPPRSLDLGRAYLPAVLAESAVIVSSTRAALCARA